VTPRVLRSPCLGLLALVFSAGSSGAGPVDVKLKAGVDYSVGDYGLREDTTTIEAPLSVEVRYDRFTAGIRMGFVSNEGPVIAGVAGARRPPSGGGPPIPDDSSGQGLSDLYIFGGVLLTTPDGDSLMPWIELKGEVKVAVADEDDGLGTGENDYRVGLDISRSFGRLTPFVYGGYRFRGDPSVAEANALDDGGFFSGGVVVSTFDWLSLGASVDWAESPSSGIDDSVEVIPFASISIGDRFSIGPYVAFGLTDGAPDYGAGGQISVKIIRAD
jgi:hypothetical protein